MCFGHTRCFYAIILAHRADYFVFIDKVLIQNRKSESDCCYVHENTRFDRSILCVRSIVEYCVVSSSAHLLASAPRVGMCLISLSLCFCICASTSTSASACLYPSLLCLPYMVMCNSLSLTRWSPVFFPPSACFSFSFSFCFCNKVSQLCVSPPSISILHSLFHSARPVFALSLLRLFTEWMLLLYLREFPTIEVLVLSQDLQANSAKQLHFPSQIAFFEL